MHVQNPECHVQSMKRSNLTMFTVLNSENERSRKANKMAYRKLLLLVDFTALRTEYVCVFLSNLGPFMKSYEDAFCFELCMSKLQPNSSASEGSFTHRKAQTIVLDTNALSSNLRNSGHLVWTSASKTYNA